MAILSKFLKDPNEKEIKKLQKIVDVINGKEKEIEKLTDDELKAKTPYFKEQLKSGKSLDDILPEAFACVREAAKRTIGQRAFDVQLIGGIVLHQGQIAEMRTGEGKTLAATFPVYLNALTGKGAHLITVNDYLATLHSGWMGQIYNFMGLSVGCVQHDAAFIYDPEHKPESAPEEVGGSGDKEVGSFKVEKENMRPVTRKEAYAADITYGTNNEFGFDYLRDNMVQDLDDAVQRDLNYVIVDEIDSILVDEARTPLIISAPAQESTNMYFQFADLVKRLKENKNVETGDTLLMKTRDSESNEEPGDYNVDEKMRAATLTAEGIAKMEKWLGVDNIYTEGGVKMVHHIENALRAHALFTLDKDYVVKDGEVIIVDEFTGRMMPGRRYSEGMHQAIEAKEGVKIQRESMTLATITFQNYFRMYEKLSGMTGTAETEAEEFAKIYKLEVTVIPTNKPMIRDDKTDSIFRSEKGKYQAIVKEIKEKHENGQPVLVGTISIERNEMIGQMLEREGIPFQLLNAKQHESEGEVIAQAGRKGAVTIATNMAGRGVDIKLGGNPPEEKEQKEILDNGGLHIIGTERHESRRIDNQLRGRAGRQGEAGYSRFFISMEDDLMRIFAGERMKSLMDRINLPEDLPIENKMVSKAIESAQHKVEGHNFDIRKHLVEYDDVINKHREVVYNRRKEILKLAKELEKDDSAESQARIKELVFEMIENEIEQVVSFHTAAEGAEKWDIEEIYEVVNSIFPVPTEVRKKLEDLEKVAENKKVEAETKTKIIEYLMELANKNYDEMEKRLVEQVSDKAAMRKIEKGMMLRAIDTLWVEHLDAMDHLRTGIGLQGYGQRDPLVQYKKEAFRMFNELINLIQKQVVYGIFKIGVSSDEMVPGVMQQQNMQFRAPSKTAQDKGSSFDRLQVPKGDGAVTKEMTKQTEQKADPVPEKVKDESGKKVGRNDPCPCGSGKKYKKCHGK